MTTPSEACGEREKIVAWLRDGGDQAAENLCDAILAIAKEQRAKGIFGGQPYFDAFANAIEDGDHLTQPKEE